MSLYHFIELGIAYLLAAMMPGPSIALIIKNALIHSRVSSIKASLGTVLGVALQSGLVLITLALIENNSILFKFLKILCSTYLIYLGIKILSAKKIEKLELNKQLITLSSPSKQNHFLEALLVEFLNPLAFTFFISIMSIFVNQQGTWGVKFVCWLEIISLSFIWFFTVSWIVSCERITFYTRSFNRILETSAGCVFILFGSKILMYGS